MNIISGQYKFLILLIVFTSNSIAALDFSLRNLIDLESTTTTEYFDILIKYPQVNSSAHENQVDLFFRGNKIATIKSNESLALSFLGPKVYLQVRVNNETKWENTLSQSSNRYWLIQPIPKTKLEDKVNITF